MLNMNPDVTAAAATRAGFGAGVFPLFGVRAAVPGSTGAVFARPGAHRATDVLGRPRFTARHGSAAGQQIASKQDSDQHYNAQTTRIVAVSDGAPGSHPAREPV